jgi:Flp pilus assembly protein TadB
MVETLVLLVLGVGLIVIALLWRRIRVQEMARLRLGEAPLEVVPAAREGLSERPFVRRHWLLPWLLGALVAAGLYFLTPLSATFAITFGILIGLIGGQVESVRVDRITLRIEQQLSDAVDLIVAALQAGAGALGAIDNAAQEARRPLKPQLEEMLGRIRYGDDPQHVLRALEARVPLETFRLFAAALSVHWETGGSLAPTLATVGRVIRDRIEVNRRIRGLTTQARASTLAVLLVTYFIGILMWRNDPERMVRFLTNSLTQPVVAIAILLQGVGLVWTAALSRMKY